MTLIECIELGYDTLFESKGQFELNGFNGIIKTDIAPEDRTLKNIPRYATKRPKVHFKVWLNIKKPGQYKHLPHFDYSWGQGSNARYYGWSHRAVGEFYVGKEVPKDCCGNIHPNKKWTIKTELEAVKQAIAFARDIS